MSAPDTRFARLYFLLQAGAVALWWLLLVAMPELQRAFNVRGAPAVALLAFLAGDGALLVGGSLLAALASDRRASSAAWVVAGAVVYATSYTVATAAVGASPWFGAALMAPSAILSSWAAFTLANANRHGIPSSSAGLDRA